MKIDTRGIMAEVRANHARLDACPGPHDFGPFEVKIGVHYTCAKCGGRIDAVARSWYERGLADAGKPTVHWTALHALADAVNAGGAR